MERFKRGGCEMNDVGDNEQRIIDMPDLSCKVGRALTLFSE